MNESLFDNCDDNYKVINTDVDFNRRGINRQFLKFGKHRIPITDKEKQILNNLLQQYLNEFGSSYGFVNWIYEGNHVKPKL